MNLFEEMEDTIHTAPDGSVTVTGSEALTGLHSYSHIDWERTEAELPDGWDRNTVTVKFQIMATCIVNARIPDPDTAQNEAMKLLQNEYFVDIISMMLGTFDTVVEMFGHFPCLPQRNK